MSPGESLAAIAWKTGHFWSTLWELPDNAALRTEREHPNVLLPGDQVTVPPLRLRSESRPIDARHRFRRRGVPARVGFVLRDAEGQPLAGKRYELEVEHQRHEGVTDGEGRIEHFVSPGALRGCLRIWPELPDYPEQVEQVIAIGRLEPVTSLRGVQARLIGLGYACGAIDGELGPRTRAAVRAFQNAEGLAMISETSESSESSETSETEIDDATRSRLRERFGV